jgi:hypothetical protein
VSSESTPLAASLAFFSCMKQTCKNGVICVRLSTFIVHLFC